MSVHVYADGFGVWHAVVPQYAYADPTGAARRAIRRELAARSRRDFDPRSVGVVVYKVENGQITYRERML